MNPKPPEKPLYGPETPGYATLNNALAPVTAASKQPKRKRKQPGPVSADEKKTSSAGN